MDYQEPFCGCFSDLYSCLIQDAVPCGGCIVNAMATVNATGEKFWGLCAINALTCCIGMANNRQKIRNKFGMNEDWTTDCVSYLFCNLCTVTQDYREVENRNLMSPN
ncbi:unnamed protein product [Blepharisma stoltei]|uniref:PLAC8 family protein n=1 Tax=Blepharisma stoltei TaxID=1481888 RepID=A0AAU9JVM9_9CILI|nr:unnamed protein product [Blepharisma stoltei]